MRGRYRRHKAGPMKLTYPVRCYYQDVTGHRCKLLTYSVCGKCQRSVCQMHMLRKCEP